MRVDFTLSMHSVVLFHNLKAFIIGHTDSVSSVAYNFDGKLIATAGLDGTARIWNAADGTLLRTLEGPGDGLEVITHTHARTHARTLSILQNHARAHNEE